MTVQSERGFYNWLIRAMLQALDGQADELKQQIRFWSCRAPEDLGENERQLRDFYLDRLRQSESAKKLLKSLEGKMPEHHSSVGTLAILYGIEYEVQEYHLRLGRALQWLESKTNSSDSYTSARMRAAVAASGDLLEALAKARRLAEDLQKLTTLCWENRDGTVGKR